MQRALDLARNAPDYTSPNPTVGAVIVSAAGRVVGEGVTDPPPGQVLSTFAKNLTVSCGERTQLRITEVQPEGGKKMTGRDFINGMHIVEGDRFG